MAAEFSCGKLMPESESASSRSFLRWLFSCCKMLTSRFRLTIRASRGSYTIKKVLIRIDQVIEE